MLKKKFDYGLVLIERLKASPGAYLDVHSIAEEHSFPEAYMGKVAQGLKQAGWLESKRGLGGGYRLIKNSEEANIQALINYFERPYEICPINRLTKKA